MLEGIFVEGLIYAIMALGVFFTFRILDFPDLTVDGSFPMGAVIMAASLTGGVNPIAGLLLTLRVILGAILFKAIMYLGRFYGYYINMTPNDLKLINLKMGLESRMKENVSTLSGGQRQALTLLMMVLSKPAIALLDEHTAALDPQNAAIVMDLTRRFVDRYRLTTLMITHNMNHAIAFGGRLLMMDAGEIIIDVAGADKAQLTVPRLLEMFADIRRRDFENDEVLLSGSVGKP